MTAAVSRIDHDEFFALKNALNRGAKSFRDLVLRSAGLFPTDVLRFLEVQLANNTFDVVAIRRLIAEARTNGPMTGLPQGHGLALPHPLDAEWRFTDLTADYLIDLAIDATSPADLILLVGVPSVAIAAARRDDDRQYFVLGEHNIISDGVARYTAEDGRFLHDGIGERKAGAVIVDPPWYLAQFEEMLGQASHHCRPGGLIFVSAPGEGVRPGIREDLARIAEAASRAGLVFNGENKGAVAYRTPFFELNALRAAGIGAWLPDWRRGNLVTYRKTSSGVTWPVVRKAPSFELTISGVRARLLESDDHSEELTPLCGGEVFPSVSRRAPGRAEASLWTSGNRAFKAPKRLTLFAMLELAVRKKLLPKRLEAELSLLRNHCPIDAVEPLIQKLNELVDREAAEAASLLGAAAWERSANDARFLNAS